MEKKRYLIILLGANIEVIIPSMRDHILPDSLYQKFKVDNSATTYVAFWSNSKLSDIKGSINSGYKNLNYLIVDLTKEGKTFEIESAELKSYFLLENIKEDENKVIEEKKLGLDELLDLYNELGWASLTNNQKQQLEEYSK